MKLLRVIVALVVLAVLAAGAWVFAIEPALVTKDLRAIGRESPELSDSVGEYGEHLAQVQATLDELRRHAEVVDQFDEWRGSEINVLGQPTQPWEVVRRRSDVIAAADVGVDAMVGVLANADEILLDLEATQSNARAFAQGWEATQAQWRSRSELQSLRGTASGLQRDLTTLHATLAPAAGSLRAALRAWASVDDALRNDVPPGLRIVTNAARDAFSALDAPLREPATGFVAAVDALGAEVDAIGQIVETTSSMTVLPSWLEVNSTPR